MSPQKMAETCKSLIPLRF